MKNFKKAISMTMAAAMAVSMMGMLPAAAEEVAEEVVEYSTIEEYIEYAIPHYVRAQSVEIDGTFYYSNTIDIYDINDIESGSIGEYVFLFDDDEIVGKMQVWQVDGEYASVFDTYITDEIQSSFDGDYDIAFGYFEDDLYSYNEVTGSAFVDGPGFEECPDYELPLNKSISKAASMDLAAIPAPFAASASVEITHVKNERCDAPAKHGLCWAACIAMLVNHHTGTSLSAKDVWRALITDSRPDPISNDETVEEAFEMYEGDFTYFKSPLSASEVLGALMSDRPVYARISGHTIATGKKIGHAVVIYAISIENATSSSANITYTIDNPNTTTGVHSMLVKANPSEATKAIKYINTKSSYTSWLCSAY